MVRAPRCSPRHVWRFPHTRGDGPLSTPTIWSPIRFSPHAWGWSAAHAGPGGIQAVFPTRVGMVRATTARRARPTSFPHTRGDGPHCVWVILGLEAFSPHAWGWSDALRHGCLPQHVFPTRVGMVRTGQSLGSRTASFPHTRGDGPPCRPLWSNLATFSPHAWGWSDWKSIAKRIKDVFPTRVGMVRGPPACKGASVSFPHTRGDGPASAEAKPRQPLFSPHAWGWSVENRGG